MVTTFPFMWDKLIGLMVLDIFGSPVVAGLFFMVFFYIMSLALRLTLEVQLVMMFFAAMLVLSLYITWLPVAIFVLVSLFVGLFVIATILRY